MYDVELVCEILRQILEAGKRIERRFSAVEQADDFLTNDDGLDRLDAICMMLIAIGESLKNLDKITNGELLKKYPDVDWKGAKGARDIISHHYFDLNAEAVFAICRKDVPALLATVERMLADLTV
ncbi:HepT-like ribonuclease domain-containing protein [Geotalea sp. SG265]|uniref:HepT-like ribonuclease domain-containing protein n=1 Tax=Geotalea sp. SG265 TaxID=2922867 RepID=UPI001FAF826C|nr:HepT-like ribonuclease domain-containing protein [Geotalea sp. SG265]